MPTRRSLIFAGQIFTHIITAIESPWPRQHSFITAVWQSGAPKSNGRQLANGSRQGYQALGVACTYGTSCDIKKVNTSDTTEFLSFLWRQGYVWLTLVWPAKNCSFIVLLESRGVPLTHALRRILSHHWTWRSKIDGLISEMLATRYSA